MLIPINEVLLDSVRNAAADSPRKRKNYNFHEDAGDPLQRMLHVMNPGTYVQPHKHESPDKREAFIVLTGRVAVVEFDEEGKIVNSITLDRTTGNYGVEIPSRTWHSLICLGAGTVVYEIKDGPYIPNDDKDFASWAPAEGDPSCQDYLQSIIVQSGLK